LEKPGMFKVALLFVTNSQILKPLSAIQSSLGSNLSNRATFIVTYLSEAPPDHSCEINLKEPIGETPAKSITVFELL